MDLQRQLCYIIDVVNNGVWLSLVERFVRDEEVARSNRVTPTKSRRSQHLRSIFLSPVS